MYLHPKIKTVFYIFKMVGLINIMLISQVYIYILIYTHALENAMATHYITLAWKIPWMEQPGRLQSMGLHRVRHD